MFKRGLHFILFLTVVSSVWIKCPDDIYVTLKPGKSSADVSSLWKTPLTSSGAKYITSSHKKTDRFPVGVSVVTWSVSNDDVNFKTCVLKIDVRGKWIVCSDLKVLFNR